MKDASLGVCVMRYLARYAAVPGTRFWWYLCLSVWYTQTSTALLLPLLLE